MRPASAEAGWKSETASRLSCVPNCEQYRSTIHDLSCSNTCTKQSVQIVRMKISPLVLTTIPSLSLTRIRRLTHFQSSATFANNATPPSHLSPSSMARETSIDEISTRMERWRVGWSIILGGITREGNAWCFFPKLAKKHRVEIMKSIEFAEIFLRDRARVKSVESR